jgi:POT family proton-dependent oligopeptide transporter
VFRDHPKGLFPLFFTEMWERFSFYVMIALLTLYMEAPTNVGGLGFDQTVSGQVYGLYMGFLYFTPLFGGLIADRLWGYMRTITLGGLAMMCGQFALMGKGLEFFILGLVCLIVGNGLFKPNISTMLGNLYRGRPEYKDAGFNLFYMGINLGAFASPLAANYLKNNFVVSVTVGSEVQEHFGWQWAFFAAGIGMIVSLIIFQSCRRWIVAGERQGASSVVQEEALAPPHEERLRMQALFIIFAIVVLFWMAFSQNGATLIRWSRDHTAPFAGIDFKESAALTKAINPALVILLTPLLVSFWSFLKNRGLEVSTPKKMLIGMLLTASCFFVMAIGGLSGGDTGRVSIAWLFFGYFLVTIGELCVSPMGLSVVSKLAPARHAGLFMGGWFVATALGNYLAGLIAAYWNEWDHSTFFFFLVGSSLFAAALLWLVLRRLEAAVALVTKPATVVAVAPPQTAAEPALVNR